MAKNKKNKKDSRLVKTGRTVSYLLKGKVVVRTIGVRTTPFSQKELESQESMRMIQKFLNAVDAFIHVGFELEAKSQDLNQQNVAFSYNRKHAITGKYPDLKIDFSKILVAQGDLKPPKELKASITGQKIAFSWSYDSRDAAQQWADQVMLLAYFPELGKAVYVTAGERRDKEQAYLKIPRTFKFTIVETYIAFVSIDRRKISNSIYTGQLTL